MHCSWRCEPEYAARLPSKLAIIEDLAARGVWDEARRAAHKLRGSAATHGFVTLGDAAARLEELFAAAAALDPAAARASVEKALHGAHAEVARAGESHR